MADRRGTGSGGPIGQFLTGVGLLARGIGMYARSPGLLLLGLVPALIAFVLLAGVFGVVVYFLGAEASALTWFARGWNPDARSAVRLQAAVAILGLVALLAIVVYAGLTLAIGDPFYEKISQRVDERLGGAPIVSAVAWWLVGWRALSV